MADNTDLIVGAASGASQGAAAGHWGAAAGAALGLGAAALGRRKPSMGKFQERLDMMLARRLGQIQEFNSRMAANRQRLLDRTQALQNLAYSRFAANLEAQFAARGKQVTGGAYQSGLGKEAAMQQAYLTTYEADLARQDELASQNQIAAAYGDWSGTSSKGYTAEAEASMAAQGAVGSALEKSIPSLAQGVVTGGKSLKDLLVRRRGVRPSVSGFGGMPSQPTDSTGYYA